MPSGNQHLVGEKGTFGSDYEKLFLLEILVVNVYINDSSLQLDKEVISNLKETCVLFQFLNYPPLVVCEEDFCTYGSQSTPPDSRLIFKSGKSCLFSLRSLKCPVLPMDFDINVSVAKKLAEGILPNKVVIGKTNINMGSSFTRLMSENTDQSIELPTPKIMRDTFDLFDDKGNKVGDITVFIRLSCFGKIIITQFQLGPDQKKFYFKGTEKQQQQQNEIEPYKETPTIPSHQYGDQQLPSPIKGTSGEYSEDNPLQGTAPEYAQQKPYCVEKDRNDNCRDSYIMGKDERIQENRWSRQQERKPYYKDYMRYDDGENSRKASKQPPTLCPYAPKLNVCDCNYPIPPEIMPICPVMQKRGRNNITNLSKESFELPPGGVGLCGDQVIFQMHKPGEVVTDKDKKLASELFYKVGAVEGGKECPKQIVQILPQKPDEVPSPTDKEDVFILKIGKKLEGIPGKTNFEVELRTPKIKDPLPQTHTQETQYVVTDFDQKQGGKVKGGKGKGKGKGKKK